MLKEKLTADLKEAMKRHDQNVVSVLRMMLSALKNKEIEKRVEALLEDEMLQVLTTEARKRKESITSYQQGGRSDLAEIEKRELGIIKAYLPEEASEDEIRQAVKEVIAGMGASADAKAMGKVMGAVMGRFKGRADGTAVQNIVKKELGV